MKVLNIVNLTPIKHSDLNHFISFAAPRIDRTSMSAYLSVLFNESLDITCLLRPDSGSAEIWWTTPTGGIVRQPHLHVDPPCNPGGYLCVANSLELCGSDNYAVAVNVLCK